MQCSYTSNRSSCKHQVLFSKDFWVKISWCCGWSKPIMNQLHFQLWTAVVCIYCHRDVLYFVCPGAIQPCCTHFYECAFVHTYWFLVILLSFYAIYIIWLFSDWILQCRMCSINFYLKWNKVFSCVTFGQIISIYFYLLHESLDRPLVNQMDSLSFNNL